jgi:hypothetical protein
MYRTLRSTARVVVLFLLAAQAALAAAPCVSASARAADAFFPMPPDCDGAPPASLCLQHCNVGDQSSGQVSPALPAPPLEVLHLAPAPQAGAPRLAVPGIAPAARALGPPIPIRNLSLLL